ncbi:MAG: ribosome-associated translation inhibitor RaiA [Bacteroidales bacterium]|nr:ribosome-associated translation inhibitor RaiA [Bacteroidales bacterium]
MNIKIQAIHFDASQPLHDFITKKLNKLGKLAEAADSAEVTLKVVKPETANNKATSIRIALPGGEIFAEKVADTFEEGVDNCIDALQKQLERYKEKARG